MKKLISKIELSNLIEELGGKINIKCEEHGGGIVFVCVLKGGFMFFSDLIKHIKYPVKIDFVKCKSYNNRKQESITITKDVDLDIKDHTVFIIDDILDSGNTMTWLKNHFLEKGAKNIETVSAVYKENVDFPNHFYIYKQPEDVNPWYVGYGMDDKGYNRNINTIHTV
jgi:hypoxanthine phosphoribosyltransferase